MISPEAYHQKRKGVYIKERSQFMEVVVEAMKDLNIYSLSHLYKLDVPRSMASNNEKRSREVITEYLMNYGWEPVFDEDNMYMSKVCFSITPIKG